MAYLDICGPVVADTAYVDSQLVARDIEITLPEVTPMTADLSAMGTMTVPIWTLFDNLEATITKIGTDLGLSKLIKPDMKPLEIRWVYTAVKADGASKDVGCKAFIRGIPNKIPGIELKVGESSENAVTFMVSRYNLFVDGEEMILIDRLANIARIGGKDYAAEINSLL